MRKLFTKKFFAESPSDQQRIVDSVLRDLAQAVPYDDTGRVKAMFLRIRNRAVEYGVVKESEAE